MARDVLYVRRGKMDIHKDRSLAMALALAYGDSLAEVLMYIMPWQYWTYNNCNYQSYVDQILWPEAVY